MTVNRWQEMDPGYWPAVDAAYEAGLDYVCRFPYDEYGREYVETDTFQAECHKAGLDPHGIRLGWQ